jgi:hypothetical protein
LICSVIVEIGKGIGLMGSGFIEIHGAIVFAAPFMAEFWVALWLSKSREEE